MTLHDHIARALGWTDREVRQFSLQSLREFVRACNPALADEITYAIQNGSYLIQRYL